MHIKTLSLFGSHRTLVVLPVFAVLCALSLWSGSVHKAQVGSDLGILQVTEEPAHFVLDSGAKIVGMPGASFAMGTEPTLYHGEVVIASPALTVLRTADLQLHGWNGMFAASVEGETLTVIALTTPVVVVQGGERLIVPIGSQARLNAPLDAWNTDSWAAAHRLLPLPAHYIRERITLIGGVPEADSIPVTHGVSTWTTMANVLQLPAAKERSQETHEESLLDALMVALQDRDTPTIQSLLLKPDMEIALRSSAGIAVLPTLLALAPNEQRPLLVPFLQSATDFWLLASAHPILRDRTWVMNSESSPFALERIGAFPASDTLAESASVIAVDAWAMETAAYLTTHKDDASSKLEALASGWVRIIERHVSEQLTERALRYAKAVTAIAAPYRETLSPELQAELIQLDRLPETLSGVRLGE
jgi:hypothetical protein